MLVLQTMLYSIVLLFTMSLSHDFIFSFFRSPFLSISIMISIIYYSNDDDLDCNNKNWMVEKDYNALYGSMEDAYYLFGVEEAPEGWAQKAITEARATAVPAASTTASTSTAIP